MITYIILFVYGVIFGSFINVLIDRIPSGKLFSKSRSYCESCGKTLRWYDLIPLVSYILLKGKCRCCRKPIPKRLFFVELLVGLGFITIFHLTSPISLLSLIIILVIFSLLVAIFFIDAKYRIIPDSLLIVLLFTTLLFHVVNDSELISHVITAFASFTFFLILYLITKGKGIGFGDVKFSFVIGFMLGFPVAVVAFYAAFLTGALISIILILIGKKKARGSVIAFGPFLIIGVVIAALYANEIISLFF